MISYLLHMNSDFFRQRVYRGLIYFLTLVVLAMTRTAPMIVLLPTVSMVVVSLVICILEYETGYLAVALSVCKNE